MPRPREKNAMPNIPGSNGFGRCGNFIILGEQLYKGGSVLRVRMQWFFPGTLFGFLIIVGLADLSIPLRASVIFSNIIGPCCGGQAIDGSNFPPNSAAEQFTPVATYLVTDARAVVLAVQNVGADPFFNIAIFSDASGIPGLPIGQTVANLTAPPPLGGTVTASFSQTFLLQAGNPFWLVLTPADNSTEVGWETGGSLSAPAAFTDSTTGLGGWIATGPNHFQFAIDGTEVPEPNTLLLAISVLLVLVFGRVRRHPRSN